MKNVKVSVILPVFNPGSGIRRCIQSLRNQTLRDIEMIFIDDRGNDSAIDVVKAAAKEDERFRILTNPVNLGAGRSRNRGIEAAEGEYLAFVDPDDYVADNFLELLYKKAKTSGAAIVKGACAVLNENGVNLNNGRREDLNIHIRRHMADGTDLCFLFTHEHWTAIYFRRWVMESGARYGESGNGEDTVFLLRVCCGVRNIEFDDSAYYYYIRRTNSADSSFSSERMKGELVSFREKTAFLEARSLNEKEIYKYVKRILLRELKVHAGCAARSGTALAAESFLKELKECVDELPFAGKLGEESRTVAAFIKYGANISLDPYGSEWKEDQWCDHFGTVKRVVGFICDHPGLAEEYRDYLWKAYDRAIAWQNQSETDRQKKSEVRKALTEQANRLPDKKVLTDNYAAMKLYIDHGIDLFRLRNTAVGKKLKWVLKKIRTIRMGQDRYDETMRKPAK